MPRGIARDHEEKRRVLRKKVADYFAAHGYDRASMTGAARHAGVSKALLYHYYDGKEALLSDILETHLTMLAQVVAAAAPNGLKALIPAVLDAYADADAEHKLQLSALSALPPELQGPLLEIQRALVRDMTRVIAAERHDLTGDALNAAAMTVFAILNWFFTWHRPGKGLGRAEYAAMATRFVKGGIAAV